MTECEYTITFSRKEIRNIIPNITDDQCDEIAAALQTRFDECFCDAISEMPLEED